MFSCWYIIFRLHSSWIQWVKRKVRLAWHFLQTRLQGGSYLTLCAMQSPQPWMRRLWKTLWSNSHDSLALKNIEKGHTSRLLDKTDQIKIHEELDKYPHPLKESNPDNLFKIISGEVADPMSMFIMLFCQENALWLPTSYLPFLLYF